MSKTIAQTVSSKKFGLALALIAVFAVLGTLGYQRQGAQANVTPADWSVTGPFTTSTGSTAVTSVGVNSASPAVWYRVATIIPAGISAGYANSVTVTFVAPTGTTPAGAGTTVTGVAPTNCAAPVGQTVTCTWSSLTTGSQVVVAFQVTPTTGGTTVPAGTNAAGGTCPPAQACALINDASASGPGSAANTATTLWYITGAPLAMTKAITAPATLPPAAGASVTYTITATNGTAANVDVASSANTAITDTLPSAFASVSSAVWSNNTPAATSGVCTWNTTTLAINCPVGSIGTGNVATAIITGVLKSTYVYNTAVTNTTSATGDNVRTNGASVSFGGSLALCAGLFQVDPFGNLMVSSTPDLGADGKAGGTGNNADCIPASPRDVDNNVIGFTHMVCDVNPAHGLPTAVQPPDTAGIRYNIVTVSGTANVNGQAVVPSSFAGLSQKISDGTNTFPIPMANNGGPSDTVFNCVKWYSTAPGEQNVTVVDNNGNVIDDWADGPMAPVAADGYNLKNNPDSVAAGSTVGSITPLVKEWNTLIPTTITATSCTAEAAAGLAVSNTGGVIVPCVDIDQAVTLAPNAQVGAIFNPATSLLQGKSPTYYENVLGQHTNAGGLQTYFVNGALLTISQTGTCGAVQLTGTPGTDYAFVSGGSTWSGGTKYQSGKGDATPLVIMSAGKALGFQFVTQAGVNPSATNDCSQFGNSTTGVSFTVAYPNNLGSVTPTFVPERLQITWVAPVATKQVLLAWAGQRIILEHDWRLPAGDTSAANATPSDNTVPPTPVLGSTCPFAAGSQATYVKGTGPGNFLLGLGVTITTLPLSQQATVTLGVDTIQKLILGQPQADCISRVVYESEDQGEVDIEAFVQNYASTVIDPLNQTKVAFVVYYMKINTVNLSAVSQVSKPRHNSTGSDFSPGNPWDASKDSAGPVDWNVSRDLLIRGRVTGWFTNSNPSGRARDDSNKQNVLPADRWVMPDDWVNLAGGAVLAQTFRPEYDIMFGPDNKLNIALDTPTSVSTVYAAVSALALDITASSTTIQTPLAYPLTTGWTIRIDNEDMLVGYCANPYTTTTNLCYVTRAVSTGVGGAAAHSKGAAISARMATSAQIEGPYSLIDPNAIGVSAAITSANSAIVRDTVLADGKVDMWDAPMPVAITTLDIRGTGMIKQVRKQDVYYNGTANPSAVFNTGQQTFPNPFYISDIPDSPFIPAVVAGGGYFWDSWALDGPGGNGQGPYEFWTALPQFLAAPGSSVWGYIDTTVTASQNAELNAIRTAYGDGTISRTLNVYSDNHGEFMVIANGDFKTDLSACSTNVLGGGKQCKPGDKVGTGTITAVVDYPDFRGKHFPVASNNLVVNWTWGGYKDVTVEPGETDQYKYVVFHAIDRDGFCDPTNVVSSSVVLLHSVYTPLDTVSPVGSVASFAGVPTGYQIEMVDFLIDSGDGRIIGTSGGGSILSNMLGGVSLPTFSVADQSTAITLTPIKTFPYSPLAASGQSDECQAWIKISNSLLGQTNVLAIAHDDEGNIGFDKVIDLTSSMDYTLNFRWSLITWAGADNIAVADALKGGAGTKNPGGKDITSSVTAVYGWAQDSQTWLAFFPSGVNVPGANNLTSLKLGQAYWVAITGPGSVTWTVTTNVN